MKGKSKASDGPVDRKQRKNSVSAVQQPASSQQARQAGQKEVGRAAAALEQPRTREKKAAERLRAVKARAQNPDSAVSRKAASHLRERAQKAAARRADATDCHVRSLVIVSPQPFGRRSLCVFDRFKQMLVQPFVSYGTIIPFDVSILSGLPRLNKQQAYASILGTVGICGPGHEDDFIYTTRSMR